MTKKPRADPGGIQTRPGLLHGGANPWKSSNGILLLVVVVKRRGRRFYFMLFTASLRLSREHTEESDYSGGLPTRPQGK